VPLLSTTHRADAVLACLNREMCYWSLDWQLAFSWHLATTTTRPAYWPINWCMSSPMACQVVSTFDVTRCQVDCQESAGEMTSLLLLRWLPCYYCSMSMLYGFFLLDTRTHYHLPSVRFSLHWLAQRYFLVEGEFLLLLKDFLTKWGKQRPCQCFFLI